MLTERCVWSTVALTVATFYLDHLKCIATPWQPLRTHKTVPYSSASLDLQLRVILEFIVKGRAAGVTCFTPAQSHADSQILTARQVGSTQHISHPDDCPTNPSRQLPRISARGLTCLQGDCTRRDYTDEWENYTHSLGAWRNGYIEEYLAQ